MKANTVILTLVLALSMFNAQSQATANLPQPEGHTPREEVRQGDRHPEESESLTSGQKKRVKAILSTYNEASLTATDAKAINNAFREAGIPNGPGLQQAIKDADFVPEKISELDPPPDRSGDERMPSNKSEPRQPGRCKECKGRPAQGKGGGYSIEREGSTYTSDKMIP